jgi:hypothetical protein
MATTKGTGRVSGKAVTKKATAATAKRSAKTGRIVSAVSSKDGAFAGERAPRGQGPARRSAAAQRGGLVDWKAAERAEFLIATLGGVTKLAEALGVAKSQPGRWRRGEERPGAVAARNLLDLDHVMGRAIQVWTPEVAARWMSSSNAHLDGATPIDVLVTRGPNEVVSALDATMSGAFA